MNEKILETLEFQRIKDQLAKYLASATGKQELAELMPQSDYETVLSWQKETMDGADILRLKGGQLKWCRTGADCQGLAGQHERPAFF